MISLQHKLSLPVSPSYPRPCLRFKVLANSEAKQRGNYIHCPVGRYENRTGHMTVCLLAQSTTSLRYHHHQVPQHTVK